MEINQDFIVLDFFVGGRLCERKRCVWEINVSRAWDPVHAGDKALTREPTKKSSTIKSYQYFWKFPIWNSRTYEKRREIRMVKVLKWYPVIDLFRLKNHIFFVFSKESQNEYMLYFLKTLFLANNILKLKSSNNSFLYIYIFTVTTELLYKPVQEHA
jgi:hypothetical protein